MNFVMQTRMAHFYCKAKFMKISWRNIVAAHNLIPELQTNGPGFYSFIARKYSVLTLVGKSTAPNSFVPDISLSSAPPLFWGSNAICNRGYAKGQNKVKRDKSSKAKKGTQVKANVELNEEELEEVISYSKMKSEMESVVRHLQEEYATQLSLRTSAGVFESLQVDAPDGRFALIEVAQMIQKNPNLVIIDVSAIPQYVTHVKAALTKSGMNLNPQQDGTTFFVPIPKVTREHREGLAKGAKTLSDKAKERLRNIQNNYLKSINKVKDQHSSNLIQNLQEIVKVTAKNITTTVDEMKNAKEKELLQK